MHQAIPPVNEIQKSLLDGVSRKAFVRAGLPQEEWSLWIDDARQVAWMSFCETAEKPDGKRVNRAKWAVFEFVIGHIYGQMTDWVELPDRGIAINSEDDEFPIEWVAVVKAFSRFLPPAHLAIAIWLLQGKSNFEIAHLGGYSTEDSARAMVSKVRREIESKLVSIGEIK